MQQLTEAFPNLRRLEIYCTSVCLKMNIMEVLDAGIIYPHSIMMESMSVLAEEHLQQIFEGL